MRTNHILPLLTLACLSLLVGLPQHPSPLPAHTSEPAAASPPKKDKDPAVPTVTLPKTKTALPNRYFCLKAGGNCTSVKWIVPAGLDQLDPEIPIKDSATAIVLIGDTGTYTVQAYGALGDVASDIASCTVTIGVPAPPTPPTPPGPVNPLTATLQAAYNMDKDADRANSLVFLQLTFPAIAASAKGWTDVTTVGGADAKIKGVIDAPVNAPATDPRLKSTQIINLRKAIGADLVSNFGTTAASPIDLTALATELSNVAAALQGVK